MAFSGHTHLLFFIIFLFSYMKLRLVLSVSEVIRTHTPKMNKLQNIYFKEHLIQKVDKRKMFDL